MTERRLDAADEDAAIVIELAVPLGAKGGAIRIHQEGEVDIGQGEQLRAAAHGDGGTVDDHACRLLRPRRGRERRQRGSREQTANIMHGGAPRRIQVGSP